MERHPPAMAHGHSLELARQLHAEMPRSVHGVRRELGDDPGNGFWGPSWCLNAALNLGQKLPTLIFATVGVHGRSLEAIVRADQVVWHDHTQAPGVRLVKRSELPQVIDGLRELPILARLITSIESRQAHAAAAAQTDQRIFHAHAECIMPSAKLLRHLRHNRVHSRERQRRVYATLCRTSSTQNSKSCQFGKYSPILTDAVMICFEVTFGRSGPIISIAIHIVIAFVNCCWVARPSIGAPARR